MAVPACGENNRHGGGGVTDSRANACSIRAIRDFVNAIKKSCLADEYNIHDIDFIEKVYLRFLTVCLR